MNGGERIEEKKETEEDERENRSESWRRKTGLR